MDKSKMVSKEKTIWVPLTYLNPVTVCLRWSIFHMSLSIFSLVFLGYELVTKDHSFAHLKQRDLTTEQLCAAITVKIVLHLVAIFFSAILFYGIMKQKASFVKAYYVYGVIKVALLIITASVLIMVGALRGYIHNGWYAVGLFLIILLAIWILMMVRRTYKLIEAVHDDRSKLVACDETMGASPPAYVTIV